MGGRHRSRRSATGSDWTAFGAMVLCVTASRAMVQWGMGGPSLESDNPVVAAWQAAIDEGR